MEKGSGQEKPTKAKIIWMSQDGIGYVRKRRGKLELIQSHMAQKPMLRGEVGARALRVRSDVRGHRQVRLCMALGCGRCGCRLGCPLGGTRSDAKRADGAGLLSAGAHPQDHWLHAVTWLM